MTDTLLERRGRALEEAFFARHEKELRDRIRREDVAAARRQAIATATGITDPVLLDRWIALNLGPGTVAALALVPMVLVAWADGALDAREVAALREAAQAAGLDRAPDAAALLDAWLAAPPPAPMEQAWRDYVHVLVAGMDAPGRAALHDEVLGRARRVAAAAGGFLGLGTRISAAEAAVLARLEAAFG